MHSLYRYICILNVFLYVYGQLSAIKKNYIVLCIENDFTTLFDLPYLPYLHFKCLQSNVCISGNIIV